MGYYFVVFFIWVYKNTFFLDLKIFQSISYDRFESKEPSRDPKQLFPKFKSPTLQDHIEVLKNIDLIEVKEFLQVHDAERQSNISKRSKKEDGEGGI